MTKTQRKTEFRAPHGLILAGDSELMDLYLCQLIRPPDHQTRHPLVRVLLVLIYPIQHAILLPDSVSENAPIWEDTVCRLPAFGPALDGDVSISYERSLAAAQMRFITQAPPEEAEIVRRHMAGIYLINNRVLLRK